VKKPLIVTAFLVMLPAPALVMAPTPAVAMECVAEKVTAGKKVFKKCRACHVADKEKNRVGPHLVGLFDRKAGLVGNYRYSKAMKKAGEEGLVWTDETLDEFLQAPKKFIPKTKMALRGIKKEDQRHDLLCYIKDVSG